MSDLDRIKKAVEELVNAAHREGYYNRKMVGIPEDELYKEYLEEFKVALKRRVILQRDLMKLISESIGGAMDNQ